MFLLMKRALELGYRWYSSSRGLVGFFLGPSVLVGRYASKHGDDPALGFTAVGGAVDLGYQAVTRSGVLWAFGAGLQVQHATRTGLDISYPAEFRAQPILPRILFSGGHDLP
jgi:hypothetical protein